MTKYILSTWAYHAGILCMYTVVYTNNISDEAL